MKPVLEERQLLLAVVSLFVAVVLLAIAFMLTRREAPPVESVCTANTDSLNFITIRSDFPPGDRDGDGVPDSRALWWWYLDNTRNQRGVTEPHPDFGDTTINEALHPLRLDLNALDLAGHINDRQVACGLALLGDLR